MPLAGLIKVVLHGSLSGGEIWETGFWMTESGVNSGETATAQAEIIWGTLSSTDPSGGMYIARLHLWDGEVKWTGVRVYGYDGGAKAAWVGDYVGNPVITGQSPDGPHPHQTSACMTLLTGLAGRSNRGRMYLPATGAGLDVDGQFTHFAIDAVGTAMALAFTHINASDAGKVVVYSRLHNTTRPVRNVRIDSLPDVQRRRANGLTAKFASLSQVSL